jgi:hypothetical protein
MAEEGARAVSILAVDSVYRQADGTVEEQPVRHAAVNAFLLATSQFLRSVGEEREPTELWRYPCSELRRARWRLGTVPLPLDSPRLGFRATAEALLERAESLKRNVDDELPQSLAASAHALLRLSRDGTNPLALGAVDYLSSEAGTALVVVTNRAYQNDVVQAFDAPFYIGTVGDLMGVGVYGSAVIIGSAGWLPRGVLNAPRACRLGLVHYDFYREPQQIEPLLQEGPALRGSMPSQVTRRPTLILGGALGLRQAAPQPQDEPLLSSFDVLSLARDSVAGIPAEALSGGAPGTHDRVDAHAAQLADGSYVLLPLEHGVHKVFLVEEDGDAERTVEAVDAATVMPGDAVVLRGGSYYQSLVERADTALGEDAALLRQVQKRWKEQLRDRILHHPDGAAGVASDLRARGATTANLAYWTGPWCIRTRRRDDFTVVMRYLGRSDEASSAWEALGRIDHAHRSAGRSYAEAVKRALSDKVWQALLEDQWCDIALDDTDAGARLAVIDAVLPGQFAVPVHYLCRLRTPELP